MGGRHIHRGNALATVEKGIDRFSYHVRSPMASRSVSERTQTIQDLILPTRRHRSVVLRDFLCQPRLHDMMNQRLALSLILANGPAHSRYAVDSRL